MHSYSWNHTSRDSYREVHEKLTALGPNVEKLLSKRKVFVQEAHFHMFSLRRPDNGSLKTLLDFI